MTVSLTGYPSFLHPSMPSSTSFTRKLRAVSFAAALVEVLQKTPSQYVTMTLSRAMKRSWKSRWFGGAGLCFLEHGL